MTAVTTGIFAPSGDPQAAKLLAAFTSIGARDAVKLFEFPNENGEPAVALSWDEISWAGMDASQLQQGFLRGFSYTNPVVPQAIEDVDWSLWQYQYIGEQQKTSFLYSAMAEIHRRGVELYNPPGTYLDVSMKIDWLERMRKAGFKLPDLLCTSLAEEAKAFAKQHAHVLWRPATGRAAWQLCLERQRDALLGADKPPVILSSVESGFYLRCFICKGEPVLVLKFAPPQQLPLEALEIFQVYEEQSFYPELRKLAQASELHWGVIHCTFDESGEVTVYDIDADPILSVLPVDIQDYLNHCLAYSLMGKEAPDPESLSGRLHPRSLPFLRRMLSVLFETEQRKYAMTPNTNEPTVAEG